jgi:Xaa-Pro aminopeptidase
VNGNYLVERERLVLSSAELRCVERAAAVTEAGVRAAVTEATRAEATDSSVAAAIASALISPADSASAWGPVVVTGDRAGIPHSSWLGHALATGPTFMEFSGTDHRYHAPVMRTVVRGRLDAEDRRLAGLARTAVASVLDNAKAGVPCSQVALRASKALGRLPEDVVFHQLFGYPVGLAHKPHWMDGVPFHITVGNHEPLREGMVFHIPGSFRRFGRSGIGLSQTFVIEPDGARVLTHGPADLIELWAAS